MSLLEEIADQFRPTPLEQAAQAARAAQEIAQAAALDALAPEIEELIGKSTEEVAAYAKTKAVSYYASDRATLAADSAAFDDRFHAAKSKATAAAATRNAAKAALDACDENDPSYEDRVREHHAALEVIENLRKRILVFDPKRADLERRAEQLTSDERDFESRVVRLVLEAEERAVNAPTLELLKTLQASALRCRALSEYLGEPPSGLGARVGSEFEGLQQLDGGRARALNEAFGAAGRNARGFFDPKEPQDPEALPKAHARWWTAARATQIK